MKCNENIETSSLSILYSLSLSIFTHEIPSLETLLWPDYPCPPASSVVRYTPCVSKLSVRDGIRTNVTDTPLTTIPPCVIRN